MSQTPLFDLESSDADRRRVEEALLEAVQTPDAYLTEIASHLLLAGGKRLRPMFSVVASQVAGAPTTEDAVQGGISCELVHLGSLYHDDVMDESPTRRGVETVNAKWGNLQAILAGDFLLARASEIAASLGTEVARYPAASILASEASLMSSTCDDPEFNLATKASFTSNPRTVSPTSHRASARGRPTYPWPKIAVVVISLW